MEILTPQPARHNFLLPRRSRFASLYEETPLRGGCLGVCVCVFFLSIFFIHHFVVVVFFFSCIIFPRHYFVFFLAFIIFFLLLFLLLLLLFLISLPPPPPDGSPVSDKSSLDDIYTSSGFVSNYCTPAASLPPRTRAVTLSSRGSFRRWGSVRCNMPFFKSKS